MEPWLKFAFRRTVTLARIIKASVIRYFMNLMNVSFRLYLELIEMNSINKVSSTIVASFTSNIRSIHKE